MESRTDIESIRAHGLGACRGTGDEAEKLGAYSEYFQLLGCIGISVNAIAPGAIRTAMTETNWRKSENAHLPFPIGRWGEPEEIAGMALALLADTGNYITGQTIRIDGGASAI
uniref:3-oxoacyl-[acyl-carrier protein] reductase n=1 Tax=Candidatus Kentrum sp. TC TaxID=2126339 RepID=A0A450YY27_9GAMM|nr:MAG: 3-oxoacyl-[acyl-carrier protein] reductase [Candidatus Kentron sp. TC]VFK55907.1 MAG: 3-oxoacyl-[acyl-carrier protein] reductase [Candidatus Kentron sp. TC]